MVEEGVGLLVLAADRAGAAVAFEKRIETLDDGGLVGIIESAASVFSGSQTAPKRRLSGIKSPGPIA